MDILSDSGGLVHVELAIPHARHILAFCDFGPMDFSRLKFVLFGEKNRGASLNEVPHLQLKILGLVP